MNKYIGTKIIEAEKQLRNNEEGYKVVYPDNYVSWSPKSVFEEAYRKTDGLTFGLAIEALKKGFKVARKGWNGKGMFVYYVPPASYKATTEIVKKQFGELVEYNAYLAIKNVNGTVSTWVPSINDVLSEDWEISK